MSDSRYDPVENARVDKLIGPAEAKPIVSNPNDPNLSASDPQHHANPNYQGVDFFALDFVRQRESIMEKLNQQLKADKIELEETTVQITEGAVKACVGESNARYAQGALKREIINTYYNHPMILHDFATKRGETLAGGQGRGPALIIGSGPTLDDCHDLIRGWQGGIFCSSSQAVSMLALGKRAFEIAIVDVKCESDEFEPLDEFAEKDCHIIVHPGVDPEIIQTWRWGKRYFRIIVHNIPFYTDVQPLAFPSITTTLYVYGCALSCQITMAALMGYNPLYLCGADFGYPRNQDRFRQFTKVGGQWVLGDAVKMRYVRHAKVEYRNGCMSDSFQAYYKQTFMNVWRLSLSDIFRVGHEGGLYEVPEVSAQEILDKQGVISIDRFISNKDKIDICERYLLQYGTYSFTYPNGQVEFVVFDDEERDLPRYIDMCNRAFAERKMPGVLILGEEKSRLSYLRNDAAWEAKEKRWGWEIKSQASPMEIIPAASSTSG